VPLRLGDGVLDGLERLLGRPGVVALLDDDVHLAGVDERLQDAVVAARDLHRHRVARLPVEEHEVALAAGGLHRRFGLEHAHLEAVVRDVVVDRAVADVAVVGDDGDAVLVRLGHVGGGGGGVGRLDDEHLGAAGERVFDLVELARVVVVGGERERGQAALLRLGLEVGLVLLVALLLQRREQEADFGPARVAALAADGGAKGDERHGDRAAHERRRRARSRAAMKIQGSATNSSVPPIGAAPPTPHRQAAR